LLRLRQRCEFEAVFAHDFYLGGRLFVVRAKPNAGTAARLGIVASKKALPRAVDRNRGKRIAREAFRTIQAELAAMDVVVQVRSGLVKQHNAAARQELLRLLSGLAKRQHNSQRQPEQ